MNRLDEIKAAALDAAQHVTQDERARAAMADDLIRLVGLMVQAVGKSVASDGESGMGDSGYFSDIVSAHTRYLTGERIQDGARWAATEAVAADLSRYESTRFGSPVWRPRCPDCGRRVGMHADVEYGPEGLTFTPVGHTDDCPVYAAAHRGDTATLVLADEVHAWVYAVDGDTGQLARNGAGELWQLCGVCGVHRNDARCIGCGEDDCGGACLAGA